MLLIDADAITGSDGVMLKEELHFVVPHTTVWCDVFGVQKDLRIWITPYLDLTLQLKQMLLKFPN